MLDEKQKLKQYFEEEIQRVSGKEIEKIESEIDTIRQKSIEEMEEEAQREAGLTKDQEIKEMMADQAIRISKLHEETNRKLMKKRRELFDAIFDEAKIKLKEYASSSECIQLLKQKASDLGKKDFDHVTFYTAKKDSELLKALQEAYGKACDGKADETIELGGFRMECESRGIVIDETFDTGLDEQKDWFYTNSGLFIK
ncbi:V-type ATP synthase subunit E family protein [Erysipelotrichaceae bacterium HCN-30851]